MLCFKYLFKFFLAFAPLESADFNQAMDGNGWVALEHPITRQVHRVEEETSVWVVFSKQLDKESFRVRFPVDPEVHFLSSEEIEMRAKVSDNEFSLQVLHPRS